MSFKEETKNRNQQIGLNRNSIDKFYTKESVVLDCIEKIKNYINIKDDEDLVIECSAGNGAFSKNLIKEYKNVISYDIEPEEKNIIQQDFLKLNIKEELNQYKKYHIISNPPFGRQSSLAKKFIKKCCEFSDSISFILPKSFKKETNKKCFDLYFHLIYEMDLPENSFEIYHNNNIREYNVPCIFQIWIKKSFQREEMKEEFPKYFKFVKKNENPNLSFRRVGVNAGRIEKDINKNTESHYFLKLDDNINVDEFLEKYKSIKFDTDNTVGPKSINKQELILKINNLF
jgi:predicted RNA methylase